MAVAARIRDHAEGNNRDDALIQSIRAGDGAAYDELWYKYHNLFINWVRRWVRCPAWEQECADQAVAVLFEVLPKYQPGRSSFCSWAHMVGRSAIIKHIHQLSIDRDDVPVDEMITDMLPTLSGPEDDYVRSRVTEELSRLEPEQQAAVNGAYFDDRSDSELSAELSIPRRRVCYRRQQGLASLRERLSDVPLTTIRPVTRFSGNSYVMPGTEVRELALLGGEEGDWS